ncbi:MAG: hypothetical protein PF481_10310 [Bacteroidales bacterium]|nr:hypothetical protein [Bacteroidales bacterium]
MHKLGYSLDQEGILNRFMREGDAWKSHLENTKQWIVDFSKDYQNSSIALFGTGWFLDIPIDYLLQQCKTVYAVDVVHPPQIVHKYKNHSNLVFVEADVTGGLIYTIYDLLYGSRKNEQVDFSTLSIPEFIFPYDVHAVVSCNILNQLNILLCDAITGSHMYKHTDCSHLQKNIQKKHLSFLQKYSYCLISDWVQTTYGDDTNDMTHKNLVVVEPPKHETHVEWSWKFDSCGSYEENKNVEFVVRAFSHS